MILRSQNAVARMKLSSFLVRLKCSLIIVVVVCLFHFVVVVVFFSISKLGNVSIWLKITESRKVKIFSHISFMFCLHIQSLFGLSAHACGHVVRSFWL